MRISTNSESMSHLTETTLVDMTISCPYPRSLVVRVPVVTEAIVKVREPLVLALLALISPLHPIKIQPF